MKSAFITTTALLLAFSLTCKAQWTTSGTNIYNSNTGNVGIGTTSPSFILDIKSTNAVLALTNTSLNANSATGETSIYLGDVASGVKMLRASKRTFNTRALEIWTEYGYNIASKAAEFYHNSLNFYTNDVNRLTIDINGNVGIGTTYIPSGFKLALNGAAIATSVTVMLSANWPDYVFKPAYQLPTLTEIKTYIDQNHHLPDVPTAADVEKSGINLGEMNKVLLQKVEELTLYLIEKDKAEKQQKEQLRIMDQHIKLLETKLDQLLRTSH